MNKIFGITFDLSETEKMDNSKVSNLRKDISVKLEKAFQRGNIGKRTGALHSHDIIQVFFRVKDYQQALIIIKSTLGGHYLFPFMKVQDHSR